RSTRAGPAPPWRPPPGAPAPTAGGAPWPPQPRAASGGRRARPARQDQSPESGPGPPRRTSPSAPAFSTEYPSIRSRGTPLGRLVVYGPNGLRRAGPLAPRARVVMRRRVVVPALAAGVVLVARGDLAESGSPDA